MDNHKAQDCKSPSAIFDRYKNGESVGEIAKSLGVNISAIYPKLERVPEHIARQETRKKEDQERRQKIVDLYLQGKPIESVARSVGVSRVTVAKKLKADIRTAVKYREAQNLRLSRWSHVEQVEQNELIRKAVGLYARGEDIDKISQALGVPANSIPQILRQCPAYTEYKERRRLNRKERGCQESDLEHYSPKDPEVLLDRYIKGESMQEIAKSLGVTKERVRQLLNRTAEFREGKALVKWQYQAGKIRDLAGSHTINEIAEKLNIGFSRVYRICKQEGISAVHPKTKAAFVDLAGQKIGRLTAKRLSVEFDGRGRREIRWVCDCDCGTKDKSVMQYYLVNGLTRSCGCTRRIIGVRFARPVERYDVNPCQQFPSIKQASNDLGLLPHRLAYAIRKGKPIDGMLFRFA